MSSVQITIEQLGVSKHLQNVIHKSSIEIGRDPNNDIILKQTKVSKRHCLLKATNEFIVVTDLGSRNGTYVNGKRIAGPVAVGRADRVFIGDYIIYAEVISTKGAGPKAGESAKRHGEPRSSKQRDNKASDTSPPPPRQEAKKARTPWEIIGITKETSKQEAKKAFRQLLTLYHPDKVAHLAPEFQRLAEEKTREILDAWEKIERGRA